MQGNVLLFRADIKFMILLLCRSGSTSIANHRIRLEVEPPAESNVDAHSGPRGEDYERSQFEEEVEGGLGNQVR